MRGFLTKKEFETWLQYFERRISSIASTIITYVNHAFKHETGGSDAIDSLAGEVLTSGTIDGDRLPAISQTKKGGVPATGVPANHYLRDTGGFEHPTQNEINDLETTATPEFAGLGIKTAGSDNHINLIDGAIIGNTTGGYLKFNTVTKILELLLADLHIGDTPAVPGTGGTWAESYDSDQERIYCLCSFKGNLYAGSYAGGKIFVYDGSSWTVSKDFADSTLVSHLYVFDSKLFAARNDVATLYYTADGVNWIETGAFPVGGCDHLTAYAGKLYGVAGWLATVGVSDDGLTWGFSDSTALYTGTCLCGFNGYLYCGMYGAAPFPGRIKRFDGVSWANVYSSPDGDAFQSMIVWNSKLYAGTWSGKVYVTSNGTDWTVAATPFAGNMIRAMLDYDAKLWVASGNRIYESVDGVAFTLAHTSPELAIFSFAIHFNKPYYGSYNLGKIYVYTDTTAVFATLLKAFGNFILYGQFRPGDMAGVAGNLLMSGGNTYPGWLGTGADGTYLAGPASGATPVYQAIPASDVVNTPAGDIAAINVQTAINELDTEKQSIAGLSAAVVALFQATLLPTILCYEGDVLTYENEVLYG